MGVDEAGRRFCDAGVTARRWPLPCLHDVEGDEKIIHVIYAPDGRKIELCDEHFNEVLAAGLVSEPYVSREYINERVGRRVE